MRTRESRLCAKKCAGTTRIVYIGQGIGPRGGNFRQTRGLWKEFGDERLRDTGICELGATGVAIGAAMAGTRTVVDEVFLDFALEAITQIVQQAANISYMSDGKIKAPVVIRGSHGRRCAVPERTIRTLSITGSPTRQD